MLFAFLLALNALADSPVDIVKRVEAHLAPGNFVGVYELTNHRLDGTVSVNLIRFEIKDVHHSHGVFQKPEREKGREILRVEDALWTYIPSVGRSMRIADRDSFAGGDFSNADILRPDWTAKYDVVMAKDSANQWILDLTAKGADAAYGKMRLWVDKKNNQPVQQHFYDSKGTLMKKLQYGSVKKFETVERPTVLKMENVLTVQRTELLVLDIKPNQKFRDSRFSVDNLGK